MARGRKTEGGPPATGVQWNDDAEQGDTGEPEAALASMLAGLDDAAEVCIWREQPGYAAGFVGTWEVHDRDPVAFLQRMQAELGGTVYRVQPLRRMVNGRKLYSAGSRRVRISGPPLADGRRWGADQGPPVIDATARPVGPPPPTSPQSFGTLQPLLSAFESFANRLGAIEARLQQPSPASMLPAAQQQDPIATTLATMTAFAKLQKMLTGGAFGAVDDDDDDDDDEGDDEQPKSIEDMLGMYLARQLDPDKPAAAPAPTAEAKPVPRLIRDGEDVTPPSSSPATPTAPPASAPSSPTEGAAAVAAKLAELGPEGAVQFLLTMTDHLPPEVQAGLAAAAMQRMQPQGNGTED